MTRAGSKAKINKTSEDPKINKWIDSSLLF